MLNTSHFYRHCSKLSFYLTRNNKQVAAGNMKTKKNKLTIQVSCGPLQRSAQIHLERVARQLRFMPTA